MSKPSLPQDRIDDILDQISMAEAINEYDLKPILEESIARYTGKHIPIIGSGWDVVLNEVFPIIQNMLPSIFFRNPHAYLKPRNKTFTASIRNPVTGKKEEVILDSQKSAHTQEAILNYSLSEMKYKQETRKVLLDALLFPYGVMWHGYKGGQWKDSSLRNWTPPLQHSLQEVPHLGNGASDSPQDRKRITCGN